MKRIFLALIVVLSVLPGCARINPRMDQKIDNANGRIDEIKSNQNGIMADLGTVRQQADLTNSQLKEVQNGLLNVNAAISRNENSGVQILQGDGPLILVFGLGVVGMLLYHYRNRAILSERAADILAQQVAQYDDPDLHENVLRAAMNSPSEQTVFHLLTKHER